jgi:hypothetical protein
MHVKCERIAAVKSYFIILICAGVSAYLSVIRCNYRFTVGRSVSGGIPSAAC